jgi:type IX secretion system PorP/SprF family membrane protein
MRVFSIIIFFVLSFNIGKSQHFPIYSQYLLNGLAINPAYAGSRDVLSTSIMYRKQWINFPGTPSTATLSAHAPMRNRKISLGVNLISERIGVSNNNSFFVNYAYRVRMGLGHLAFGLKAGTEILHDDYGKISTKDDDVVFSSSESFLFPNVGFGMYYSTSQFFMGASIPSFLSYKRSDADKYKAYNDIKNYNFLISSGYLIWVNNKFKLKPSTLLRYHANSPFQFDCNLNAILLKDGLLWLGLSYRYKEALVGLVEVQMGTKWRLGFSYDYTLGKLSGYNMGSIEIMLRMELISVVKTINPLFF